MSHIDVGFAVVDLQALAEVVAANCPELEMVADNNYRVWATVHGYVSQGGSIPPIYQLQLVHHVLTVQKQSPQRLAATKGIELPEDLTQLEMQPWDAVQQAKLLQIPEFMTAFKYLGEKVVGRDAVQVIRFKAEAAAKSHDHERAFEIGVVPHPLRPSAEYLLMTDTYRPELLRSQGVGGVRSNNSWGADLKRAYATRATVRHIEQGIQQGQYTSYQQQVLENGSTRFVVEARQ
jgi:hypothetical protein